jgi:thymidine kinase
MLEVITGCMFAGKSTELLRRIRQAQTLHHKVFVINFCGDVRYGSADSVRTHNGDAETASIAAEKLLPLLKDDRLMLAQFVAIDEAHFFPDLLEFVRVCVVSLGKHVCVVGLDADSWSRPFESMMSLLPLADNVIRLTALCQLCGDGQAATLTKRRERGPDLTEAERLKVGGAEQYIPVCRKHFFHEG